MPACGQGLVCALNPARLASNCAAQELSLALTVPVMAIALWRSAPETRRRILPWLFAGGGACALAAGLVLWKFDPARISDQATYDEPHSYAIGVSTVVVNGEIVVDGGDHTGALPGRRLHR